MKTVADIIVDQMKKDLPNYPIGYRFLTQRQAMTKYHASNIPVQKAFKYLSAMGYISQKRTGAPYYVRKHP